MGGDPETLQQFQTAVAAIMFGLYVFVVLILVILPLAWLVSFLSFAGITGWPANMSAEHFLTITAVVLMSICAVLGIGGVTGILSVEKKIKLMIWTGFLSGVMLAFVNWIKHLNPV